jgi:hypothetical protein
VGIFSFEFAGPKGRGSGSLRALEDRHDYQVAGAVSLPGAIYDAHRIKLALEKVGFETEVAPDLAFASMKESLNRD